MGFSQFHTAFCVLWVCPHDWGTQQREWTHSSQSGWHYAKHSTSSSVIGGRRNTKITQIVIDRRFTYWNKHHDMEGVYVHVLSVIIIGIRNCQQGSMGHCDIWSPFLCVGSPFVLFWWSIRKLLMVLLVSDSLNGHQLVVVETITRFTKEIGIWYMSGWVNNGWAYTKPYYIKMLKYYSFDNTTRNAMTRIRWHVLRGISVKFARGMIDWHCPLTYTLHYFDCNIFLYKWLRAVSRHSALGGSSLRIFLWMWVECWRVIVCQGDNKVNDINHF